MGVIAISMLFSSCSKNFLDTEPGTDIPETGALGSVKNIEMSMLGVYRTLVDFRPAVSLAYDYKGFQYLNIYNDIIAGYISRPSYNSQWSPQYVLDSHINADLYSDVFYSPWYLCYNITRRVNSIIDALAKITPSDSEKELYNEILGQAHTLRAYMYHTLNVQYAPRWVSAESAKEALSVPIRKDVSDTKIPRNSQFEVNEFILSDISTALTAFAAGTGNLGASVLNINATKLLKARVEIYTLKYTEAVATAKELISSSTKSIMGKEAYTQGFNATSNQEWIFGGLSGMTYTPYNYSFYRFMGSNYDESFPNNDPNVLDVSYLIGKNSSDLKPGDLRPEMPNTVGLTMRSSDSRSQLFITDTPEQIAANVAIDASYYYDKGFTASESAVVFQGRSKKFLSTSGTSGLGDLIFMRLAEAYYIVAEASYMSGDMGTAKTYFESTVTEYDNGFVAATGADLLTQIKNFKAVDMWGEGRGMEDVKRRGDYVYRIEKFQPNCPIITRQYSSVSPFVPAGTAQASLPDYFTLAIPEAAIEANPELVR